MVIDDFDIVRVSPSPDKADAPALVDADAVLTSSIADKLLKTISRWNPQVVEDFGDVEDF